MGYKLCIAEKPSAARDIARVIGAAKRNDGYIEGGGYIVTWAIGHLVELAPPEAYGYLSLGGMFEKGNPESRARAKAELPLFPAEFKTVAKEDTRKQFEIVKELMNRADVDLVIDCGDMGAEGHYLQWLIRKEAGCRKPVKRFCATSLTDEAIREAMANLRDISEFDRVILGEWCKHRADWVFGLSMSRAASLKHGARVDVGRVLSPTLFFIVKRYIEAESFKPTDYFTLSASFAEGFGAAFQKDAAGVFPAGCKDGEGRVTDKDAMNALRAKLLSPGAEARVTGLATKRKSASPPQLYDITELMRDANRLYGYSADETLTRAQSLYEKHKILSYPRTDSRFLTSDLGPHLGEMVMMIAGVPRFAAAASALLAAGWDLDGGRIVDDSKVTDHHALIVTGKLEGFDLASLSREEENIIGLVMARIITALGGKHTYDETTLTVEISGGGASVPFPCKGRVTVDKGFLALKEALFGKDEEDASEPGEASLPPLAEGQLLGISGIEAIAGKTAPPRLHTEATLLTEMENAGRHIENGAILKGKGIGTQATRAAIIKGLFDKKYVAAKEAGKAKLLVPTKQGLATIKVLPPDCYTPRITADWEERIAAIAAGEMGEGEFMSLFREFITEKLDELERMAVSADFKFDRVSAGACPWCGAEVTEAIGKGKDGKESRFYPCADGCGFSLGSDNHMYVSKTGRKLTLENVKALLEKGSITATCKRKDGGGTYKAVFSLDRFEGEGGAMKAGLKADLAPSAAKGKGGKKGGKKRP